MNEANERAIEAEKVAEAKVKEVEEQANERAIKAEKVAEAKVKEAED